jgi:hypothetical protein
MPALTLPIPPRKKIPLPRLSAVEVRYTIGSGSMAGRSSHHPFSKSRLDVQTWLGQQKVFCPYMQTAPQTQALRKNLKIRNLEPTMDTRAKPNPFRTDCAQQ